MTLNVNNLNWRSTGKDGSKWVGLVVCDSVVDKITEISVTGNVQNSDYNISPRYLIIDNLANNGTVTIDFGSYQFSVPPFQREPFDIPDGLRRVKITVNVGAVNCWFSEEKIAADQSNNLLVQQTAALTLIYTFVGYNANQNQLVGDLNKSILFAPTAGNMTYSLLPIGATPVSNGWLEFIDNFGTQNVTLAPNGADTINYQGTLYTAGSPLVLTPGSSGYLRSDGTKWYFAGTIPAAAASALFKYITANNLQVAADKGKRIIADPGAGTNITYTLLQASTLAADFNFKAECRTGTLTINVFAGDTAYGGGASLTSMVLRPGDTLEFINATGGAGVGWAIRGTLSIETAEIQPIITGAVFNVVHGFGKIPVEFDLLMRCKVAEAGYAINDEINMDGILQNTAGGTQVLDNKFASPTNVGYMRAAGTNLTPQIIRKDTQAVFNATVTAANWAYVLRARAFY